MFFHVYSQLFVCSQCWLLFICNLPRKSDPVTTVESSAYSTVLVFTAEGNHLFKWGLLWKHYPGSGSKVDPYGTPEKDKALEKLLILTNFFI